MKQSLTSGLCAVWFSLGMLGVSQASGDPVAGKAKADTCLGCHGVRSYTNVYPTYHVPSLAFRISLCYAGTWNNLALKLNPASSDQ